uniref:Uncharacterized protein n=1 Tax=Sinocyclocheilus grahami TaxID=75366 RepID=A0A672SNP2_SINGR
MAFNNTLTSRAALLYDEWLKEADPRTENWLLMASPFPQTIIIAAYVYFGKRLPKVFQNGNYLLKKSE